MTELANSTTNNFINYITAVKPKISESTAGIIKGLQYCITTADVEKAGYFFEKLKNCKLDSEVLKKLLNELEISITDNEWAQSEYKKKLLLSKISVYFEDCFDNIGLDFENDELYEKFYFDFVKSRNEIEFGYSYLAFVRYYMAAANYELAFNIIEIVINKFPDSKFEFLALCDLLDIYKTEFDALDRNNEDFSQILEKITQLVFYILKSYSYQDGSFNVVSSFSSMIFRNSLDSVAMKMFEKISDTFTANVYEEEIKLNFVNYYIGRQKYNEAIKYLAEFENVFPKNNKKIAITIYRFETYVGLEEIVKAYELYKAIDEKSIENDYDLYCRLYMLFHKFGLLLEKKNSLRESISVYERIYKNSPLKKLKEEALYKLITLNINNYFNNKANIPDDQKNIIKGYCMSFITKFPKSEKTEEVKLIHEGLNITSKQQASSIKEDAPAQRQPQTAPNATASITETNKNTKADGAAKQVKPEIKITVDTFVKNEKPETEGSKSYQHQDGRVKTAAEPKSAATSGEKVEKPGPADEKNKNADLKSDTSDTKQEISLKENLLIANAKQKSEYITKDRLYKTPESLKFENKNKTHDAQPEIKAAGYTQNKSTADLKAAEYSAETSAEPKLSLMKVILYLIIMFGYYYLFVMIPTSTIIIFYTKMIMSYIPVLLATGFVMYYIFKKIKIFE